MDMYVCTGQYQMEVIKEFDLMITVFLPALRVARDGLHLQIQFLLRRLLLLLLLFFQHLVSVIFNFGYTEPI